MKKRSRRRFNCFNSCPREGAITTTLEYMRWIVRFQLMLPRGGNLIILFHKCAHIFCFNSCPREGAIPIASLKPYFSIVSTHAPARGQSGRMSTFKQKFFRFNSCPREGAIRLRGSQSADYVGFNSCPREGAIFCAVYL